MPVNDTKSNAEEPIRHKQIVRQSLSLGDIASKRYKKRTEIAEKISSWPVFKDIYPFYVAPFALGSSAAYSAFEMLTYFRRRLKVLHYGTFTTYIPVMGTAAMVSYLFHQELIRHEIYLQTEQAFPYYLELKGAGTQVLSGVVAPFFLSFFGSCWIAASYATQSMPYIHIETKKTLLFWQSLCKPWMKHLATHIVFHMVVGAVVTHSQIRKMNVIIAKEKLRQLDIEEGMV